MKILIVGHACGPGLGSEPASTWNWGWHLSGENQVWVIAHPEYKSRVDSYLAEHPNGRIHFVWVTPKSKFDYWTPGVNQERGIRLHYWFWMREAYKRAVLLHDQEQFDLVHHVSWSTIAVPPPFWKLPIPAVWGPIGGGQSFPLAFISQLRQNRVKEAFRTLNLTRLSFSPKLRKTLASTSLVLATNLETKRLLERAGASQVRLFLDCGVENRLTTPPRKQIDEHITLLWAGRLEPQKGLAIALHALAKCQYRAIRLLVAGSGSEQIKLERLAKSLKLTDRVEFLGQVPSENMTALFQNSHALVFTSLRDSFGSVVLEAMSNGLPIVALNHQGIQAFVPEDASIKVPVNSPSQVIDDLARAFESLGENPESLLAMSEAALAFAEQQTWRRRAEAMNRLFAEVINGTIGSPTNMTGLQFEEVPSHRSA
jgi:glycosyltransferase involved in cell wall biosynthesis